MAKRRWARRCTAHRTDGRLCRGWAITGGAVCRVHGGSALQIVTAAYLDRVEAWAAARYEAEYARWRRELDRWQARRVQTTAELLGVDPESVGVIDIVLAHCEFGRPPLDDEAPRLRPDRRFRLPPPPPVLRQGAGP